MRSIELNRVGGSFGFWSGPYISSGQAMLQAGRPVAGRVRVEHTLPLTLRS